MPPRVFQMNATRRALGIAAMVVAVAAHASDQPPVRYAVEVKKAGAIVECPSGDGILGQEVRIPLSVGATVVAVARPRAADGRSRITIRVERSLGGPDGLEFAYEISGSQDLAKSAPSFEVGSAPDYHFTVRVKSPPLLATTRNEPDWRTKLHTLTPARSVPPGECKPVVGEASSIRRGNGG